MQLEDLAGSECSRPATKLESKRDAEAVIAAMENAAVHLKGLMDRVTDFLSMAKAANRHQLIQGAVASEYGIDVRRMFGKERPRCVVTPRHVAMYLTRELLGESHRAITKEFKRTDHATVCHACKHVRDMIDTDRKEAERISNLKKRIECMLKSSSW